MNMNKNKIKLLLWAACVIIIVALLWITISYYSRHSTPFAAFVLLIIGLILLVAVLMRYFIKK